MRYTFAFLLFYIGFANNLCSQNSENDFYKIITLPVPEGVLLEVGGLTTLPNGNIAAATRRGEVWVIDNPYMLGGSNPRFTRFAHGMHENLGLAWQNGALLTAQRGELTRLRDTDGDGYADRYEAVYQVPVSGHYHEYTFGPKIAPDGGMFITGNVAFGDQEWWRGESRVPWRGWTMRVAPDGTMTPWATGMRSPCGIGMINGEFFYADNQGDWMGSGSIVHVEKGDFTGHPAGLRWADRPESPVKVREKDIYYRANPRFSPPGKPTKPENIADERPTPLFEVAENVPGVKLPAVWLPHTILGISTSEIIEDTTKGAFGPFSGQIFVGDQGQSKVDRVYMEKVKGVWQGAAFQFIEGFQSGILRMCWGTDGSMFVGETNRGWGSAGTKTSGLQRLVWTGKIPFEMKEIHAMPDGFELIFTQPVDKVSASNPDSYDITGFIYKYHPVYGSPVVNERTHLVHAAVVSEDGLKVRLVADSLRQYYIHEIKAPGVKSYSTGTPLLHATGYYTLNQIPDGSRLDVPRRQKKTAAVSEDATDDAMTGMQHADHAMPIPAKAAKPAAKLEAAVPAKPAVLKLAKRQTKKPEDWDKVDQSIALGTIPGLKYNQTLITVKSGNRIKLAFSNNDDMPHNCVVVKPGMANEVGTAAMNLGLKGQEMNYIPKSGSVLFHTKLVGPGATDAIYFVAPAPGDYTIVCTVPGHSQVMRSVLRVTK